ATALGIDQSRALAAFRHGDGPRGIDDDDEGDEGDDDDDDDGRLNLSSVRTRLADQMAKMLGTDSQSASADPKVQALVDAAANDDVEAIDRLLAEGAAIDAEAPTSLPGQPMAGLGQFLTSAAPKVAMTPLLAAIANKRRKAVERLLEGGANPNR